MARRVRLHYERRCGRNVSPVRAVRNAESRCVERLLGIHAMVEHVAQDLHVTLRLHPPAHHAEARGAIVRECVLSVLSVLCVLWSSIVYVYVCVRKIAR